MKKIITLSTTLLFALFVGVACADHATDYGSYDADNNQNGIKFGAGSGGNTIYSVYRSIFGADANTYDDETAFYAAQGETTETTWAIGPKASSFQAWFISAGYANTLSIVDTGINGGGKLINDPLYVFPAGETSSLLNAPSITIDLPTGTEFAWMLESENSGTFYSESARNGGLVHMIALDVTDEMKALHGITADNYFAYMLCWEDLVGNDNDYQDAISIVSFYKGGGDEESTTPEPATIAIFGFGLIGAGVAARRRNRK